MEEGLWQVQFLAAFFSRSYFTLYDCHCHFSFSHTFSTCLNLCIHYFLTIFLFLNSAIWFRYDLSPITVKYIERRKPFYHFITTVIKLCFFVYLFVCVCLRLFVFVCLFLCLFVFLSVCLSVFVCLSVCLFMFVYLFVCLFVCLLFIHLFIKFISPCYTLRNVN